VVSEVDRPDGPARNEDASGLKRRRSVRPRLQPLGPKLRPTARIGPSVLVKGTDKRNPVLSIWRSPVLRIIRAKDIKIVAEELLTPRNILERDLFRVSQHVIQDHKSSRPPPTRFAVKMGAAVLGKRPHSEDESIHFFVERACMIGHSKA